MKILVIGDLIRDHYRICKLKGNLCQEMPLPQLELVKEYTTDGGAGLVVANLRSLSPDSQVDFLYRTTSIKERIGITPYNQWVCRLDFDAFISNEGAGDTSFEMQVYSALHSTEYDLVIVSDYGKHTLNYQLARMIVGECSSGRYQRPLFVDARRHWDWYIGAYAAFPNDSEYRPAMPEYFKHVIHKAGAEGCYVDGVHIPTQRPVSMPVDICGAGDVFLAAFVSHFGDRWDEFRKLEHIVTKAHLNICAGFANRAAGLSCEHFGTYVVKPSEVSDGS